MKKIIITMLVAMLVLATAQAKPEKNVSHKNVGTEQTVAKASEQEEAKQANAENDESKTNVTDKVKLTKDGIVVKDDNGNAVEVNVSDLNRIINEHLDDTVLSITPDESIEINSENVNAMAQRGMDLAQDIARAFFVAIVFIVFFSLLFYYLHRRRKYKTVDRAIQAGYPLPDEFFGKRSLHTPQQPTNVYVTQVPPPSANSDMSEGSQPAPGTIPPNYGQSSNPLNNITDWTPFKKGIRITAWGLGLLFFFWILGAQPMAALMVIVVFIGLGKLFITYQEQQSLRNQWQQQQWMQQPQQPQQGEQQQWQQWGQQQTPNNVPPMPETPPEFNQNR
ncbi:MAG: hypothetical protein J5629_08200 [Muribaculaceae bacterium]|nr:hypothetical protein [Muribaculaceae bacterium]